MITGNLDGTGNSYVVVIGVLRWDIGRLEQSLYAFLHTLCMLFSRLLV